MKQHEMNQSAPIYDCIVIGGGISGISFAHYLSGQGKKVLILEKENQTGGQIHTFTSTVYPDFWTELGAHTCYNSYTRLLSIVCESGWQQEILSLDKAKYLLFTEKGQLKGVASQLSFFPLAARGLKLFFTSKEGKSIKQFFRPIVGASNYDRIFRRLFRAVICQNPDDYPAAFFLKRRKERLETFPRKYTFRKGLSSLLPALTEKEHLRVETSREATGISYQEGLFTISTSKDTFRAHHLAMATPPQITAGLLKDIEPSLSKLLQSVSSFHSESVAVIINKNRLSVPKLAGIIPVSDDFLSVVSRDVAAHPHLRGFTFHFQGKKKTAAEKQRLICQVLDIREEDILECASASHLLPSPRVAHIGIARQIEELRIHPHLFLLGNYFYGLSLEDCVNRSWEEFNRWLRING